MKSSTKQAFSQVQHISENLWKNFSLEGEKLANNYNSNPKNIEYLFNNWIVDVENKMQLIEQADVEFFNEIKGKVHSFEKAAIHFVKYYKNSPKEKDATTQIQMIKALQSLLDEMRSLLDQIF